MKQLNLFPKVKIPDIPFEERELWPQCYFHKDRNAKNIIDNTVIPDTYRHYFLCDECEGRILKCISEK